MPNNWKIYKLSELSELITKGTTPSTYGYKFTEQGVNYIKSDSTSYDGILDESVFVKVSIEAHEKLKRSQLQEDDILFSIAGAYLGKSGVVRKSHLPANTNQANAIIRIDQDKAQIKFISLALRSPKLVHYVNASTGQSAQPNLNLTDLGNLEFQIPPLPEQKGIANILSTIDDKIENNLATNKTLEDMAMALYKHWFVDFEFPVSQETRNPELVSGSHQASTSKPKKRPHSIGYKSAGGEFIDSELGPIPKGWEVRKFNEFIEKIIDNRGKTPPLAKEKTNYLLLETYQLTRETLFPKDVVNKKAKYVTKEIYNSKKWFRKGHPQFKDILFATVGNGIPNWSLMYENDGVGIAQNVVAIRPKNNISSSFLRYSFESKSFLQQFDGYVITTAQPSIKLSDLSMIDILMPKDKILNEWNDIVDGYVKQTYSNYKENKNLVLLRDTLLPKLISGEMRLKEFQEQVENIV
ncbi:restriction endonuclease subunit S [Winogradskyella sp.]|uniref:restriction endonuclease subunit S n=1 Tax=Winogradskyella sp. TaxID=1883156 RepID=UPI003AB5A33A